MEIPKVICCICKGEIEMIKDWVVLVKEVGLLAHRKCLIDLIETSTGAGNP